MGIDEDTYWRITPRLIDERYERWSEDQKSRDLRSWAIVASWARARAGKSVGPEDYFPFLGSGQTKEGGEEVLLAIFGEEAAPDDPTGEPDGDGT